jgi:iron complex outermembrane receptor protein
MGYRIRPLAAAMAVVFSSSAFWPEAYAETQVLDDVVVSASKLRPLHESTVIDADHLATMRASTSDTASLLRDVPGVSLYSTGGVSSLPAIHGLADDRLRIKVDGMDLIASCPNHMNPALSYLDPSSVDSLKVYAGITPVSVGGDSIGGTIIATSKAPEFAGAGQGLLTKGEIGAFYRSNGNANGANLAATLASESFSVTYTGAIAKADNYSAGGNFKTTTATGRPGHTLALDEVGSTAYETRNHTLGFAMKGGSHLVEAKIGYQDLPYQLYPNQRMDMLDNQQLRLNLRYLGQFDWGVLEARAYHERVDHYMDFGADKQYIYGPNAPSTIVAPGMPMYTKGRTNGAVLKADIELSKQDLLRVGGEYQAYRLDDWWPPSPSSLDGFVSSPGVPATYGGMAPNTFWNINNGRRDRYALFAELDSQWTQQWSSLFGVRGELVRMDTGQVQGYNTVMAGYAASANTFNARDHQRTDENLDLTASARYTPDAGNTFEFGYAMKTRSPNLYERYSWSQNSMALIMNNFVGDGNGYLGNLDLKPEKAHTLSATADLHGADRRWEIRATPFYTHVDDYIDAVRCTGSGMMMNALCGGAANNTATGKFVQMRYANQTATLYGLDLSGRMPLAATGIGEFGLRGLVNYTKGRNDDTHDALYNVMPLNAKLILTHQTSSWNNALEFVSVQGKHDVSDVRNEIKTSGYSLVNLRASYTWNKVRVDFGVENLFDKFYSLPLGGAYSGQGTTMSTNGIPWGIAVPGMGRSYYAGLNLKF